MNEVMREVKKAALNAVIWTVDILCTPITLTIYLIGIRKTRMEKIAKKTLEEVEYAQSLIGEETKLTAKQYGELIEVLSRHYIQRVYGKLYWIYKLREYQAWTLDSEYWKDALVMAEAWAEDAVQF